MPHPVREEFDEFVAIGTRLDEEFDEAHKQHRAGAMSDEAFAQLIESEFLPRSKALSPRLVRVAQQMPDQYRSNFMKLPEILRLEQESWQVLASAVRYDDDELLQLYNQKHEEIERLISQSELELSPLLTSGSP